MVIDQARRAVSEGRDAVYGLRTSAEITNDLARSISAFGEELCAGASVSGLYLAHPAARFFSVGRVGADQVADYAVRRGMELVETERWLGPNLAQRTAERV